MTGRKVSVPEHIRSVFNAGPYMTPAIYALAPDTLIALSFAVNDRDRPYLQSRVASLPVLGGTMGQGQQVNPETLLATRPDVALAWASGGPEMARTEQMFEHAQVPLVYLKLDRMADYPDAMRFLGVLLGREKRGHELATYIESALKRVADVTAGIPESQRVRFYYAESADGLSTECHRSFHAEPMALAGGYNVHRCEFKGHYGMEKVSIEQVMAYDPDVIVTQDATFATTATRSPAWQSIRAVREHHIYFIPTTPFNWVDRPPSIMRALAVQWLTARFYPDRFHFDHLQETRIFFERFLGTRLSARQVEAIFSPQS